MRFTDYLNEKKQDLELAKEQRERLPSVLQSHCDQAIEALESEVGALEHRYRDDADGWFRRPYMGYLEVATEYHDSPVSLFGSSVRCHRVIRFKIHGASQHRETGDVRKEELINEFCMSEKQLGEMVSRPNGPGDALITQVVSLAKELTPYDPEADPLRNQPVMGKDDDSPFTSLRTALSNLRETLEAGADKGRVGKREIEQPLRSVSSSATNLSSNLAYRNTRYAERLSQLAQEGALTLHLDARPTQSLTRIGNSEGASDDS